GGDGHRDAARRRGGPARVQGGPDPEEALRHGVLAPRGCARLGALSLCLVTDRDATRGRDLVAVVAACVAAGLRLVQGRAEGSAPSTTPPASVRSARPRGSCGSPRSCAR